jgi:hypothetical protein
MLPDRLADSAQVVGGKLYLLGGGWDMLTVNTGFPVPHQMAVAVAFRVPYSETNRPFDVEIEIQDADGRPLVQVQGKSEVGRPPGIPQGHPQRTQIAANMGLQFEKAGTYVIVARVDGQDKQRVPFNIIAGPALLAKQWEQGVA